MKQKEIVSTEPSRADITTNTIEIYKLKMRFDDARTLKADSFHTTDHTASLVLQKTTWPTDLGFRSLETPTGPDMSTARTVRMKESKGKKETKGKEVPPASELTHIGSAVDVSGCRSRNQIWESLSSERGEREYWRREKPDLFVNHHWKMFCICLNIDLTC